MKIVATGIVVISVIVASAITLDCLYLAWWYVSERGSWCGSGRMAMGIEIESTVPIFLPVPFIGWYIAWKSRFAVPVARYGAICTMIAWPVVYVVIRYRL